MRKLLLLICVVAVVAVGAVWWFGGPRLWTPARSPDRPAADAAEVAAAPNYIARVTPEEVPEGMVYHVRPTRAGRLATGHALDIAWLQAVDRGVPARRGLREQFMCHPLSLIARAKSTWDLDAWRPTVGQLRTMLAGCDPS